MIKLRTNPTLREQLQFVAIWLPAFFALLGGVVYWRTASLPVAGGIWVVGLVLSLLGLMIPPLRRPLFVAWMVAAYPIGWTISHLVLIAIYYLVVTPIGLAMRLSRDPLERQFDRSAASYWVPRQPRTRVADYFKQY